MEALTVLLIVDNEPNAEDEWFVLTGHVAVRDGEEIWQDSAGRWLPLQRNWRELLREVKPGTEDIFGCASHFLPRTVHPEEPFDGVSLG